jgi:hypothetical protein
MPPSEPGPFDGVLQFLDQVDLAVLKYPGLALVGALMVPGLMAALDNDNGWSDGRAYSAWWDSVSSSAPPTMGSWLTGDEMWELRCAVVHEGRTGTGGYNRGPKRIPRITFMPPAATDQVHISPLIDGEVFVHDVSSLVRAVSRFGKNWIADPGRANNEQVLRNARTFLTGACGESKAATSPTTLISSVRRRS